MPFERHRIRDPLHNLIEFHDDELEDAIWRVLQTRPFQRLRRVKQLGFSELVYPGATHSRFAHSVGVFHTARRLVNVVTDHLQRRRSYRGAQAQIALAAALVHDVGHGPFSHAFEDVGRRLKLKIENHERMSDLLIRRSEVSEPLERVSKGFASNVADMVHNTGPKNLYGAVVSSQFDADRLDYVRRDRLMTGAHHGAIDFDWLLSNIEVGEIRYGVDTSDLGTLETFVLGPKALYAAETYLLGLFQLYPTVYFHKATRGAEKLFSEILFRVITLVRDGSSSLTGLPRNHPLIQFAKEPDKVENFLNLDDTVIWGGLPMMSRARDKTVATFSQRLKERKLFKCYDVRPRIAEKLGDRSQIELVDFASVAVRQRIVEWERRNAYCPRILIDEATREPYKQFQESKGPLNQIMLRIGSGPRDLVDVARLSKIVSAIEPFKLFRLYASREDDEARKFIDRVINEETSKCLNSKNTTPKKRRALSATRVAKS